MADLHDNDLEDSTTTLTFDEGRFKQVVGHFATGVTIVTATADDGPAGMTVQSFLSVSLVPPLVAFAPARTSTSWPHMRAGGRFCVNILREDQEALARTFGTRGAKKFDGVAWTPSPSGSPVLAGALAWIDCTIEAEHEAGDHTLVVGRVRHLDQTGEGRPLIFYRAGYGRFEV